MKNEWVSQLEKILTSIVVVLMVVIIGLNGKDIVQSQQRTVIQSNTKVYDLQSEVSPKGEVSIKIDQEKIYPDLEVLVNGELLKTFGESKHIKVKVQDGDLLQVNGSMYQENIKVVITKVSNNIKIPKKLMHVVTRGNIQVLSTIRIQ